jgi:hypothetical protein
VSLPDREHTDRAGTRVVASTDSCVLQESNIEAGPAAHGHPAREDPRHSPRDHAPPSRCWPHRRPHRPGHQAAISRPAPRDLRRGADWGRTRGRCLETCCWRTTACAAWMHGGSSSTKCCRSCTSHSKECHMHTSSRASVIWPLWPRSPGRWHHRRARGQHWSPLGRGSRARLTPTTTFPLTSRPTVPTLASATMLRFIPAVPATGRQGGPPMPHAATDFSRRPPAMPGGSYHIPFLLRPQLLTRVSTLLARRETLRATLVSLVSAMTAAGLWWKTGHDVR